MSARKKWMAGSILVGVLVFGIAIGSVSTWILANPRMMRHHDVDPAFRLKKEPYIEIVLGRLERELNLNPEQREAIRKEMQGMAAEFRSLHEQTGSDMRRILDEGQVKIKSHLTTEQIEQFEEHMEERHFHMRMGDPRDDHGPDGGKRGFRGDRPPPPGDDFPMMPPPPPPHGEE